jgi:hypothetical protein
MDADPTREELEARAERLGLDPEFPYATDDDDDMYCLICEVDRGHFVSCPSADI